MGVKILFFGEDIFSLTVAKSLCNSQLDLEIIAVVILSPVSVSGGKLVKYCMDNTIPIIYTASMKDDFFLSKIASLQYDLTVSAHFQRILPFTIFGRAKFGGINLHPSLLPKYRGMSPQHWPIILGDIKTGVTVHRIDTSVDTGNILIQEELLLTPNMYIHELQIEFLKIYKTIVVDALKILLAGYDGYPQDNNYSYFHKIVDADREIKSDMNLNKAYAIVRAFSLPYGCANYRDIKIIKAEPLYFNSDESGSLKKINLVVGEYCYSDGFIYLMLNDGVLKITKWSINDQSNS